MTKHRLEIFSDGVFAIVLTILVLDLHVPSARGLAGLWEVTPALLVHAATFFTVGAFWHMHHGALARVTEINTRTLLMNLVALFWITLLPFGARNAAERPLDPLGASMIAACCGFYFVSVLAMRLSAHSTIDDNPNMRAWRRRRIAIGCAISLADIVCAGLAWVSPWIGYGAALTTVALVLLLPSPPEAERVFERQADIG
jgi:uncharacterized membrane protein